MSLTGERLLELAVEHSFLARDSADRLQAEASKLSLPVEALAMKAGILAHWQIQALRTLDKPKDVAPGYEVIKLLGRGGFGNVYRAVQLNLSREVALKTIPLTSVESSAARRFEREAKIVGRLRHPHIVAAYDFGYHNDLLYLSLELVEGSDLSKLLKRAHKFDEITSWYIIRQTVTALAYAAEQDVTHRDIKPSNLLVTKPPVGFSMPASVPFVKVSDFGLACFSETRKDDGITLENSGLGTPSYVAPEQLTGDEDVDVRADIYSLGATAFELLTGAAPYESLTPMQVAKQKLSGAETWPHEIDGDFTVDTRQLIGRMSNSDRSERFSDHEELLHAIDNAIANLSKSFESNTQIFDLDSYSNSDTDPQLRNPLTETAVFDDSDSDFELGAGIASVSKIGSSKIESIAKPKKRLFSKWMLAMSLFLLVALATTVTVSQYWKKNDEPDLTQRWRPDPATTVRSYNGRELDYSKFKLKKGKWEIGADEEGGNVLAGTNCLVLFPCQGDEGKAFETFQFSIGVGLKPDLKIKLTGQLLGSEQSLVTVNLNQSGVEALDETGRGNDPIFPWRVELDEANGYSKIVIERQPEAWLVFLDSELVARIENKYLEPATIGIEVDRSALFEDPEVTELVSPQ